MKYFSSNIKKFLIEEKRESFNIHRGTSELMEGNSTTQQLKDGIKG